MDIVTLAASKKYTDKKIAESASVGIKYKIVDSLPSSGETQTIYFVKNNNSWLNNYYDEYLWISSSGTFEKIGSTEIPATLPNPQSLTFTGAVEGTYDGSSALTVNIPSIPEIPTPTQDDVGKVPVASESGNYVLQTFEAAKDGKSAYQYAQEGGYTGTEEAFAEKLAQEPLIGTTDELTPTQVYQAVSVGIPVKVQYTDSTYGLLSFTAFNVAESLNVIVSQTIVYYNGGYILAELNGDKSNNTWGFMATTLAQKTDIPTDDHINELIDTKLVVIENGAY